MSGGATPPDERMWLRRVRFDRPPTTKQDTGPLLIRTADGSTLFHHGRWRPSLEDDAARIDMAYPTAPAEGLSPRSWIARWRPAASPVDHARDVLLRGVPALLALLPLLLLLAPSDMIRAGLVVAAVLLFTAARRSESRARRDESLRIHARLWDHLLRSPPPPADPDDPSDDAHRQAFRLRQALECAITIATARRRIVACALSLAAVSLGLLAVPFPFHSLALAGLAPAAVAAGFVAGLRDDRCLARLDLETDDLGRIENRYAARIPTLRQLGLADTVRDAFITSGERQASRAFDAGLARTLDRLLPSLAAATAALVVVAANGGVQDDDLAALLLVVPAIHATALLGRHCARLLHARRQMAVANAYLLSGADNEVDDWGALTDIVLDGVSFRHEGMDRPLLENLSLTLTRGEVVALKGPSGSGKSTLLDILMGLCPPQSGTIAVNGRIRSWQALSGYRARIAGVFQDSLIGFSTIRAVIAANAPDADEADILRAAEDSGLSRAIGSLPMGMETLLVEGAFPASLLQQVLIAQALAQQPDLLVLDEAFSSLDCEVADGIIAAARRRKLIVIFATHRGDLAALADRSIDLSAPLEHVAGNAE